MIVLRELKEKDAPFMLEWMQDADIQRSFKRRMADSTIEDVLIISYLIHFVKIYLLYTSLIIYGLVILLYIYLQFIHK